MSHTQITAVAPALTDARFAVLVDGIEEAPQLRYRELLVDQQVTTHIAAMVPGESYVLTEDVVIRRIW